MTSPGRKLPGNLSAEAAPWMRSVGAGLADVGFRRNATKVLLPIVYLVSMFVGAVVVPVVVVAAAFRASTGIGLLALVLLPVLVVTLGALIRLVFELVLSMARLAGRVVYLTEVAADMRATLTEMQEPMQQMSADLRSVQFWRFRDRRQAVRGVSR